MCKKPAQLTEAQRTARKVYARQVKAIAAWEKAQRELREANNQIDSVNSTFNFLASYHKDYYRKHPQEFDIHTIAKGAAK